MSTTRLVILMTTGILALNIGFFVYIENNNSSTHLRALAKQAVEQKASKAKFLEMVSTDPGIKLAREYDPADEITAFADVPNRIFNTNISVTVKFKDDHATQFTVSVNVAAM